jgi:hypothetical protein
MNLGVYVVKVHIYMNEDEKFYDANKAGKESENSTVEKRLGNGERTSQWCF